MASLSGIDQLAQHSFEDLQESVFDRALKCVEENYCSDHGCAELCPQVCGRQFELALKLWKSYYQKW